MTAVVVAQPSSPPPVRRQNPYQSAVLALFSAALFGAVGSMWAGVRLGNFTLADAGILLLVASGVLLVVAVAQHRIAPVPAIEPQVVSSALDIRSQVEDAAAAEAPAPSTRAALKDRLPDLRTMRDWLTLDATRHLRVGTGALGMLLVCAAWLADLVPAPLDWRRAIAAAAGCLAAAGLAMTASRYLDAIESPDFADAPMLCRGARVVAWFFVFAAASMTFAWAAQPTAIRLMHLVMLLVIAGISYPLLGAPAGSSRNDALAVDIPVLTILASRPNLVSSMLDAAERQLGIDVRSTWALAIVRRSIEPLLVGLCAIGWLSTSLTVVRADEQLLVERLGVARAGPPLTPGLHLHWPWPIDRVFREPVTRVQTLTVGHEGEETDGPEDVLWARMHAGNEYTLLLGDGRDLITVDAAVQFTIKDARAWRYHVQNPADALRAIAYRAVMRSTVNRTLTDALSQNVALLTAQMREMVQQDADALGLGVGVVAFTVGGMHPPVAVATYYQAVVSAALRKVSAVVDANAYRNQTVPSAEAAAVSAARQAAADAAMGQGRAAGEAWAFRTLQSEHRVSGADFAFRRRLETLETGLSLRKFTVIDSRIQRDGGELWLTR